MTSSYHLQQVNNVLNRTTLECLHMLSVYHNLLIKNAIRFENALLFNASTWAAVHTTQLVFPSHCPSPDEAFSLGSHTLINQYDTTVTMSQLSEEFIALEWTMTNLQRHMRNLRTDSSN
ncbi:hypothetical protein FVEG_14638 [Fusarium verticillioides 7600]|uniref:Uncharacterized protein n=1 Tax=Gibberella moniliformis (strain M3125 / FGSC 7600) TaxID=334819 RepID=W7LCB1_GIBM7|nr:hypothetical protein FVEG_14638 [Fusarium verticillioides 7600]EWG36216.1 hypothetical protein FVEG_14638 [Fusarium verticillioides 7600]